MTDYHYWRISRSSIWIVLLQLNFMLCWSLNDEGIGLLKFRERVVNDPFQALSSWNQDIGETDHCSWFGVECVDGHVASLDLKNLCLEGTLTPELHRLSHVKSIILRNNSFSGIIPEEIKYLKELELLDLGYNNFNQPFPPDIGYSIPVLLLDNNGLSFPMSPELEELMMLSDVQVLPYDRLNGWAKETVHRRMLQDQSREGVLNSSPPEISIPSLDNKLPPTPKLNFPPLDKKPPLTPKPQIINRPPPPPQVEKSPPTELLPPPPSSTSSRVSPPPIPDLSLPPPHADNAKSKKVIPIVVGAIGGFIGLVLVILGIYLLRNKKINTVRPRAVGLSGQLQKAFVTGNVRSDGLHSEKPSYVEGVSNLKRFELETACEAFSNIVGSSSIGTIYKGTLSNGIEIAVISLAVASAKDWSRNLQTQFRKKIETLSKVNHKNFVNLIGYSEEEEPFTRMLIFEYVPNGSLFEHLYVREAEHLDWGMRLRVAMGMAYCLEHMHQLVPPVTHPNLNSSSVNLSEDYAAKLSPFSFWNEVSAAVQVQFTNMCSLSPSSATLESNVYSFGLVLLEMMTGRVLQNSPDESWFSGYLEGELSLQELVDRMLRRFDPEQLEQISELIRKCLNSDPQQRPTMRDATTRLREITGIERDKATPRLSSLWWEEMIEIRSVNGV